MHLYHMHITIHSYLYTIRICIDTRRRSAMELVRALLKFFNIRVTNLCIDYITVMLEQYRMSTNSNWKAKDAALHLLLAVAVTSTTSATGIYSAYYTHMLHLPYNTQYTYRRLYDIPYA